MQQALCFKAAAALLRITLENFLRYLHEYGSYFAASP